MKLTQIYMKSIREWCKIFNINKLEAVIKKRKKLCKMLICAFWGIKLVPTHHIIYTALSYRYVAKRKQHILFTENAFDKPRLISYHTYSLHRQVRCSVWQNQPNSSSAMQGACLPS